MNRNVEEIYDITDFIRSLTDIVKDYFHMEFDLDSLAYNRFITHLRFLQCDYLKIKVLLRMSHWTMIYWRL